MPRAFLQPLLPIHGSASLVEHFLRQRAWQTSDFLQNKLPTQLDGVGVTVNGESAFVSYVSPTQINILVPADVTPGQAQIKVTNSNFARRW